MGNTPASGTEPRRPTGPDFCGGTTPSLSGSPYRHLRLLSSPPIDSTPGAVGRGRRRTHRPTGPRHSTTHRLTFGTTVPDPRTWTTSRATVVSRLLFIIIEVVQTLELLPPLCLLYTRQSTTHGPSTSDETRRETDLKPPSVWGRRIDVEPCVPPVRSSAANTTLTPRTSPNGPLHGNSTGNLSRT